MSFRTIGIALIIAGAAWLAIMLAFVGAGLADGKLQGAGPAILGLGFFGLLPALFFWTLGAIFLRQAGIESRQRRQAHLHEEILQRVMTRGQVKFDELASELQVTPQQIEEAIYNVVGLNLFTGYVNWPGREMIAMEAEQISGDKCPNCGGAIELAGKSMARCPYCGTQTFLPLKKG